MQASFSDLEYDAKKRLTRRDRFLAEIESVTPWTLLVGELEPFYPKGEGRGRPPIGLEKMLRMYIAQQCFGFSGLHVVSCGKPRPQLGAACANGLAGRCLSLDMRR